MHAFITGRNIRLVNGAVPNEGRLEVRERRDDNWGTVCDDGWQYLDGQVACRLLGYITTGVIPYDRAHFGRGSGQILLDDLMCNGYETSLFQCQGYRPNCDHDEDAGLFCSPSKWSIRKKLYRYHIYYTFP